MFYCFDLKKSWKFLKFAISLVVLILGARFLVMSAIFDRPFNEFVEKYAKEYGVDENLVYSVMFNESHFKKDAVSNKDAKGLMQITERTGTWGAQVIGIENFSANDLFDPETNIRIGCWYLRNLIDQYDDEIPTALAAYNAGSGNVSAWLNNPSYSSDFRTLDAIPFKETEKYVYKVNYVKKIYDFLY